MKAIIYQHVGKIGILTAYQEYAESEEDGMKKYIPALKMWEGSLLPGVNECEHINVTREMDISKYFPEHSGTIFLTGVHFQGSGPLKKKGVDVI